MWAYAVTSLTDYINPGGRGAAIDCQSGGEEGGRRMTGDGDHSSSYCNQISRGLSVLSRT